MSQNKHDAAVRLQDTVRQLRYAEAELVNASDDNVEAAADRYREVHGETQSAAKGTKGESK